MAKPRLPPGNGAAIDPEALSGLLLLNLANKAAFAIAQQAVIILKQGGHESLFSDFVREFAPKMAGDDQTKVTDDIVDWLWAESPGAHYGLHRQVGEFREFFLKHRGGVSRTCWAPG